MRRVAAVLALALPLAAFDLAWKNVEPTPSWAYHSRSPAWLALSVALVFGGLVATRVPSLAVLPAAAVMTGGVLGNALSAAWNDLRVPNPIVYSSGRTVVAFNIADVLTMVGILGLTAALAVALVRNRHLLPTRQEARARWSGAFQRRP